MEPGTRNERKLCCRYCGELSSAYPSGGQQICCRCEKIREHADTFLQSDDEILLYVQDRLRRNEKKADERAEQAECDSGGEEGIAESDHALALILSPRRRARGYRWA